MERETKEFIAVLFGVALIASLLSIGIFSLFFLPKCGTTVQNVNKCNYGVFVVVPTTTVPTVRPTVTPTAVTPVKTTSSTPTKATPTIAPTTPVKSPVCEVTDNLNFLLGKWNLLNGLNKEAIAQNFSFYDIQDAQNKTAEGIMSDKITGYQKDRRAANITGTFKQMIYSLNGSICTVRDIAISYPGETIPTNDKVYVLTTDDPRSSQDFQIVFVYDQDNIVLAGWGIDLKIVFAPGSGGDGSPGGGGGSSSSVSGGGPGSPADVPA